MDHTTAFDNNSILLIAVLILTANICLAWICGKYVLRYKKMTMTDSLTGSLRYTAFLQEAAKVLASGRGQHVVVTMQVRNYRQIVKSFGGEKGKQILIHLYHVLKAALSTSERIARTDGSTFCFLLKNRQEDAIRGRLARIYESANQFNQASRISYDLDLAFAICIPKGTAESVDETVKAAAAALDDYAGESRYHFFRPNPDDAPSRKLERIAQMEQDLKNGEFVVFLQPRVRLSDNRIVGAEAQLRWKHQQRGILTPDMFQPLLEEYHLLPRYEKYLLEQVCRQMAQWAHLGWTPCPVSVGLSWDTVKAEHFAETCVRICGNYGIAPELIEFELQEAVQHLDPKELYPVVEELHASGFRCALGCFGRRILPLHFLRELNIDTVKLDRVLFSGENNNRRNRSAVDAVLKLASQMQIRTVAEGIDNVSQARYLKQAGCDLVQGSYYFLPMSTENFCLRAYREGELCYLEESGANPVQAVAPSGSAASGKITMFSLQTATDQICFSSLLSPVQEGKLVVEGALALLRYSELIHENDRKDFFRLLERCQKETGWVENTIRFYTGKDRYEWLEVHMHRESAGDGAVISGTLVNTTGWKNEVNRWKEKANRDALTGLYNREFFEQSVSAALDKGSCSSAAIVFVDIDDFKKVNDTLGHMVGDDVICSIAKRLLGTFRHSDVVARYGGDEFVVFVNGIRREELTMRLQQLRDGFRHPYRNDAIEYPVSGSIGAAMFPEDGGNYLQLLDHADSALYVAKRQGKNQFVFYRPEYEGLSE